MLNLLSNINNDYLRIFLFSMFPITEQRLSIPYFMLYEKISWYESIFFSLAGNLLIGIIVFIAVSPIMVTLSKVRFLGSVIRYILNKTNKKMANIKSKNKYLGLILFIGIPLPFTGVWTGSLGAYILGFSKKHAFICMFIGLLLSAIIIGILTYIGNDIWILFIKSAINKKLGFE